MRRRGFTLIELLVVIAIIAILAAIMFPVFTRARLKAREPVCQSNLKQIAVAIMQYAGDYGDYGPFTTCGSFWRNKLSDGRYGPRYTDQTWLRFYSCPAGGNYTMNRFRGQFCPSGTGSNPTPWQFETGVPHPEATMLVADGREGVGGGYANSFWDVTGGDQMQPRHVATNNLAFCDGHAKAIPPAQLRSDYEAGISDADGDGIADGYRTGQGNWWCWYF